MSFKRTLITLVLFLVVLGAFLVDHHRKKSKEKAKETAEQLLQMDAKAVDHLTLKNSAGQFELAKESPAAGQEALWRIAKPIETGADREAIDSLIASLAGARKQNAFILGEGRKPADYGLEKPKISAEVKSASKGEVALLSLGDQGTDFGQFYASLSTNPNGVFLVNSSVKDSLDKKLYDLRDKTILRCPADDVTTVTLTAPKGTFHAEKRKDLWRISQPVKDTGDKTAIPDLLRKVNDGKAADFVDTTGTLNLALYGLEKPGIQLAVWGPNLKDGETLLIGDQQPEETRYYAKTEKGKQVFMIPEDINKELTKDFNQLRSKELFPGIASSYDVASIRVQSARGAYTLNKDNDGHWSFDDDSAAKLDDAKVNDLVSAFTDLRVKDLLTDAPVTSDTLKYGFEKPQLEVELAAKDRSVVDGAQIGLIDVQKRAIYARRTGAPSLFGLEWTESDKLLKSRDDLIERKLANFANTDVTSIDIQKAVAGKPVAYHFEKAGETWKGRQGATGDLHPTADVEVTSFLNSISELRYKNKYLADSQDPEVKLAPFNDLETTLTLKNTQAKPLLDVAFTVAMFDQRWVRQEDGVSYSIQSTDYKQFSDSLDRLINALTGKTEEKATPPATPAFKAMPPRPMPPSGKATPPRSPRVTPRIPATPRMPPTPRIAITPRMPPTPRTTTAGKASPKVTSKVTPVAAAKSATPPKPAATSAPKGKGKQAAK